jgi:hypothetical protein
MVSSDIEKRQRKCVHELHVISARKLPGMDVGSTLKKPSLVFQNKIVAHAKGHRGS